MATVVGNGQVKLNNGQTVTAQQGGWYDAQQYWGGTLSSPGVINSQSNQQGAGQAVSQETANQTNPNNYAYIQQQQAQQGPQQISAPSSGIGGGGSGSLPAGTNVGGTGIGTAPGAIAAAGVADNGNNFGTPPPNLQNLYTSLASGSGISDMEKEITDKTTAFNTEQSKINDNPYLSEADRTGQIAKLTTDYNNDISTTQNALTMAKQDIQTQLDIATQQFNINSTEAQQNLNQFNMLLTSGALTNASATDIASITAATGIPSSEIGAAIQSAYVKNIPTSVQTIDDGSNQYAVVLNTQTGAVISKTVLGASAIAAQNNASIQQYGQEAAINAQYGATGTTTTSAGTSGSSGTGTSTQSNVDSLITSIKNKITLQSLVDYYGSELSVDQIYNLYNQYSPWGKATETLTQVKQGKYND